jgi:hypothetical protein
LPVGVLVDQMPIQPIMHLVVVEVLVVLFITLD